MSPCSLPWGMLHDIARTNVKRAGPLVSCQIKRLPPSKASQNPYVPPKDTNTINTLRPVDVQTSSIRKDERA